MPSPATHDLRSARDMIFIQTCSAFIPGFHCRPPLQKFSNATSIRPQTCFHGQKLPIFQPHHVHHANKKQTTRMLVDPWSVSPAALDTLSAQLFAISLAPYLTFLYYLNRPSVKCPPIAEFGFRFLLVFVFATIPAGIYAKTHYHDILANVDILHGGAESLLTVTNLLIVLGFRGALLSSTSCGTKTRKPSKTRTRLSAMALPLAMTLLAALPLTIHAEPGNALSFPTWIIHISSLVEWLVAMGLVWRYGNKTGNARWKGLTWGMLPLHTSGILACTYHVFYNAPSLNVLVTMQAFLTCVGNGTMAYATYRIAQGGTLEQGLEQGMEDVGDGGGGWVGFEDLAELGDSDMMFFGKVFLISALGSAGVKWGELLFDQPFHPNIGVALGIVGLATGLNMLKWTVRSGGDESFGGMF